MFAKYTIQSHILHRTAPNPSSKPPSCTWPIPACCALAQYPFGRNLMQSPSVGAVWETFVFAQLRDRERRAGRTGSLFFWRDRTREVDFVSDAGGRLELFESKWTELPGAGETVNLEFVRDVVGKSRIAGGAVVCRAPNGFPFANGFRGVPVTELPDLNFSSAS